MGKHHHEDVNVRVPAGQTQAVNDTLMPRTARLWVYSVTLAIIPLGIILGWWDETVAALVPPIVLALLNLTPDDVRTVATE